MINGRTESNGTSTDLDVAVAALEQRGIDGAEDLMALTTPANALAWCRWFDGQPGAGKRLLAAKVRSGDSPPRVKRSMVEEQRAYGDEICAWLNQHLPEVRQASGQPHPAAIAEVIRLHFRLGRGSLRKREHGPAIRASVKAWEKKWA